MSNQRVLEKSAAQSPRPAAVAEPRGEAVAPFPRQAAPRDEPHAGPLAQLIVRAFASTRRGTSRVIPYVVPSEQVAALIVALPRTSARQRRALLTFAVEERVGVPVDSVVVEPARLDDPSAPPQSQLALVISRGVLAAAEGAAGAGAPILPDFFAIRRPDSSSGAPVWAVWREGARSVVRRSDGTGFAVGTDALPALWLRAGRPALLSLGAALPSALPATDLSQSPPDPEPLDLAFSFRRSDDEAGPVARPLVAAAAIAFGALVIHLALAAVDAVALGRIAERERAAVEAAIAPILPGVELGVDPAPILARLAPAEPAGRQSDFLPLMSDASSAIAGTGRPITIRRLSWGAQDGTLSLLVQGVELEDLQAVEEALRGAGLVVTSGAAIAGEGSAEVEMRLARGSAG